MCSIDASKAFDRVNILLLFRKLKTSNFCPLFLRYLINSYCNQMMMVRWNRSLSSKFDDNNGVKTGWGIFTFIVFCLLERSIMQLRNQNIGCHMNSHFVGAVIYADDITLLGPTRNSVMALLDICSNYAMIMILFLIHLEQPAFIFHVTKVVFQEKNCHLWALLYNLYLRLRFWVCL